MFSANVWHWWLGVGLALAAGLTVLALVAGYLAKVVSPQHPRRRRGA
jgi:hypothetical protein